jgi:hypothetical protein
VVAIQRPSYPRWNPPRPQARRSQSLVLLWPPGRFSPGAGARLEDIVVAIRHVTTVRPQRAFPSGEGNCCRSRRNVEIWTVSRFAILPGSPPTLRKPVERVDPTIALTAKRASSETGGAGWLRGSDRNRTLMRHAGPALTLSIGFAGAGHASASRPLRLGIGGPPPAVAVFAFASCRHHCNSVGRGHSPDREQTSHCKWDRHTCAGEGRRWMGPLSWLGQHPTILHG